MIGLVPIVNPNGKVKQQVPPWLYLQLKTKDVLSESYISSKTAYKQPFGHRHKHNNHRKVVLFTASLVN